MKWLALQLLRLYSGAIAPFTLSSCRFYPTCSQYGYQAIEKYGAARGGWLTVKRLSRCHPLHSGGVDEVS